MVACPGGSPGHAGAVGPFCPWREEEKERMGSTESGLADGVLPWLTEATLCGALNSPAGLTFLSLRGAAPASFPDPFPVILEAQLDPFPPSSTAQSSHFFHPVSPSQQQRRG